MKKETSILFILARIVARKLYHSALRKFKAMARFSKLNYDAFSECANERKVHLGCGDVNLPGYINVDGSWRSHVHYIHDLASLPMFSDGFVDLVYSCHVLEHFPPEELDAVVAEWARILRVGGVLRISVPDFDKLIDIYNRTGKDPMSICTPLMGYKDGYNSHLVVFNQSFLIDIFERNGFNCIREWQPDEDLLRQGPDWSSKVYQYGAIAENISLNLEATKK